MTSLFNACKARIGLIATLATVTITGCGGGLDPILGTPGVGIAPTVVATAPVASTPSVTGVATNSRVSATFSKPMASASLTTSSFTVACPSGSAVAGSVAYDAATRVATFTPAATLAPNTICVATITSAATDDTGFKLAAAFVWSFVTAANADTVRPAVVFTAPAAGAANVANNTRVSATFSEDMALATVSGSSFTLTNTSLGNAVAGTVSYSAASRTAVFTPSAPGGLPGNTVFTATVTTATTDLVGNALASNHVWRFTTAAIADSTRPTVASTVPAAGAANAVNNTRITAVFSEDMDASTISGTSFTVTNNALATPVAGTVSYAVAARTATFTPSAGTLADNTAFTATVSSAATDLAGNALAGNTAVLPNAGKHVWTFSTVALGDTTAPTVTTVNPLDAGSGVCLTKIVTATFSEAMDAATIDGARFTVSDNGVAVAGTVTYDAANQVARFAATNAAGLAPSRVFVATVVGGSGGVKDLAGNPMAASRVWRFTTGTQPCAGGVDLRSAATFGSFGGAAGITNQGINTVVGGNIGTTAACTLITGFHDATNGYTQTPLNIGAVNGSVYCAPPAPGTAATMAIATQALADAQSAYNALAALPPGSDPGAGQLGGLVLASGVYTAAGGSFGITTADLTLDAQGDSNAVWVFQSASALTVGLPATPRRVLLINGAQARNVFWQVGSAARIEDRSAMVGTIIAPAGVTISTAGQTAQTTLTGRAIGLTASVTMVNTTIVAP